MATKRTAVRLHLLVWGYLLLVVTALFAARFSGDRWWPATLLLFGPRWALALPLVIILPLAIWLNRRLLWPVAVTALLVFGPFMGLCLPLGGVSIAEGLAVKVLTCNIQNGNLDRKALSFLIFDSDADIVALQECPREIGLEMPPGWYMLQDGELAVLSRFPLRPGSVLQTLHPPHRWPRTSLLSCTVQTTSGEISFCTVHLPSPRYGLQNMLDRRTILSLDRKGLLLDETANRQRVSRDVRKIIASLPKPVIVAGDFNMPVDSAIYQKDWSDLTDAFSQVGFGYGWTERANVRGIGLGVRIDHILTDKGLAPRSCKVGSDVGSDHLPVIAELVRGAARP